MNLYEKIMALYPSLETTDFIGPFSTITLRDNLDERGEYIAKWNHPTLAKPTEEQLK
jgi:hypothetical protein